MEIPQNVVMVSDIASSNDGEIATVEKYDIELQNRSSPLSILELSCGDSEDHPNKNYHHGIEPIEIVADLDNRHEERRYYDVSILPTIHENTASEEERGESNNNVDTSNDNVSNVVLDDLSSLGRVPLASPRADNDSSKQEARKLIRQAAKQAAQGKEDKAVETYKRALFNLKQGVKIVYSQMEMATNRPKLEKSALYIVLHEEWTEFSLVIAEVRCELANIYQRKENMYDQSIRNLEEAKSIYRHQAEFDERHHKKGSTAHEKVRAIEKNINDLHEAKGSLSARKSLHETIDRIREKIKATKDQTSITFLQEDLHEQISIVLSLETVHLGESHPQVADTKELLGMLYFERGQVEKSLQLMMNSVDIMEKNLGLIHPRTGLKYKQAGKMYEKLGGSRNRTLAIQFYEKAIKTLRASGEEFSQELCTLLNDAGVLYMQERQYELAIKCLDDANRCWSKTYKDGDDGNSSVLSIQIWLHLAECYAQSSEQDLAATAIRKALNLQKYLQKSFEDESKGKRRDSLPEMIGPRGVAETLKRLGKVLASQCKFTQAYDPLLEALSILRGEYESAKIAAATDPTIDLPQCQDEVASVLYCIAEVKQADKKTGPGEEAVSRIASAEAR
ncbi:expressed tetratricopeptide repeat protein [Nitzschia inconspicua]|uniref:Tetratricopeptide repeat protein n=1 Tax=Nitzschia inconspicua TaxID=303405 RepID=A0A9K3P9H4_9STRA|nr:tetratricopeptide repeat protein [Nitzschia inconspicua]KAG7357431.1 expressed tetratricopeptide repeat protein [Nitzschia inconspicua]